MKKGLPALPLIAFAALFALFAAACGDGDDGDGRGATPAAQAPSFPAGSTMAQIQQRGRLVIGVKYDVPLFGLLDPVTRRVDGFDVALGKEIAKALGLREDQVEFVEAVTANRIPFLQEDRVDLVISTFTITEERKQQIEFSRPYYQAGQSILVPKSNTTINSVNDLNGKRVCAQAGSTSERNVAQRAPQAELLPLQTISACVQAMKDGRVDAVSTDDIQLAGFAANDNSLKLVGGQFTKEPYGVGMKKGKTDMQKFVDDVINEMLRDGRWERIYNQYLGRVEGLPAAAQAKADLPSS
ncbi:MAG TPA: glutamate ABC transporter substrate-binding protein [Dehalococcoidia bacterium]|nr:glutamate ABC transporter substrate-binding protein [Dehalococcoidia bacterium]